MLSQEKLVRAIESVLAQIEVLQTASITPEGLCRVERHTLFLERILTRFLECESSLDCYNSTATLEDGLNLELARTTIRDRLAKLRAAETGS